MSDFIERLQEVVESLIDDGVKYLNIKNYDKAQSYFQDALDFCEHFDKDHKHPFTASAIVGVAVVYYAKDLYDEALKQCELALAIREDIYQGEVKMGVAVLHGLIGSCYYLLARYKEGQESFEKQLKMLIPLEKSGKAIKEEVAIAYNNIAACCEKRDDYECSLLNNERALEIREDLYNAQFPNGLPSNVDSSHYDIINDYAESLRNIGDVHYRLGINYNESLLYFLKALELKEKVFAQNAFQPLSSIVYTDITELHHNISLTCQKLGMNENIIESNDELHQDIMISYSNLTKSYGVINDAKNYSDLLGYCIRVLNKEKTEADNTQCKESYFNTESQACYLGELLTDEETSQH